MRIDEHPLFKQAAADVAETNRKLEEQRLVDQAEAARLRADQGQLLRRQYLAQVDAYTALRDQLHEQLQRVWLAAQAYHRLTSQPPPGFPEAAFMSIHLPQLAAEAYASPWGAPGSTGQTTTQAAVNQYFATMGKGW